MTMNPTPPHWAEAVLRLFLARSDFDSVSGDLLEEYRLTVHVARGRRRANVWYATQVLGFAWRRAQPWAILLAVAFIARTAIDWRVPTTDFGSRSALSTTLDVGILLLAGFWAGVRSGSFAAGPAIGVVASVVAAPIKIVGVALLLARWHDPATMAAIHNSGGLAEVFELPLLMFVPAVLLGSIGGSLGALRGRMRAA